MSHPSANLEQCLILESATATVRSPAIVQTMSSLVFNSFQARRAKGPDLGTSPAKLKSSLEKLLAGYAGMTDTPELCEIYPDAALKWAQILGAGVAVVGVRLHYLL
jgi:hypothetical protein